MKKFWLLLLPVFLLIGCNEDEIDNLKQDYINSTGTIPTSLSKHW